MYTIHIHQHDPLGQMDNGVHITVEKAFDALSLFNALDQYNIYVAMESRPTEEEEEEEEEKEE